MGIQDPLDACAKREIGGADNSFANAGLAIRAAFAHCGDACHEFSLADRLQCFVAIRTMEGSALNENGRDNVVTGVGVGE